MGERIILDPPEISTSRSALDITPWIKADGADWGDAQINPLMADRDRGSFPVDFTVPNRTVEVPLIFTGPIGGTSVVAARANIQAKIAIYQKEGGWLKRILNTGGTVYADIVDAVTQGFASVAGWESRKNLDIDSSISLTCIPDFYQDEITLGDHTEGTNPEILFTETNLLGDYPARVRMVVDDDQGVDQRGLMWAYRSRYYSSANTAKTAYEAEDLHPIGGGTAVATTLASGPAGKAVKIYPLFPTWTPVLDTPKGGTAHLTHKGTNRVWARVIVGGTAQSQVRLTWDVNDLVNATVNEPWTLPNPGYGNIRGTHAYIADLGEVRLDPSPVGVHRWMGQIDAQAYNTTSYTTDLRIDKVWVTNADEGMGILRAPQTTTTQPATLIAFDDFSQAAGALSAAAAPLGGNWDGAGDADDFNISGSPNFNVTRSPAADADLNTGRYAILDGSSTLSKVIVKSDVTVSPVVASVGATLRCGVLARYVDTNNWLFAGIVKPGPDSGVDWGLSVIKRVAGTVTPLCNLDFKLSAASTISNTIQLSVDANGTWIVYSVWVGSAVIARTSGNDTVLATGNALEKGKVGLLDAQFAGSGTYIRSYDNFQASLPTASSIASDAVVYANRSAQITTEGNFRLDSAGAAYGPVSVQTGDLPRLPVAGLESRTTEVFVKASRGDLDQIADDGIDNVSCRVYYRPSYLNVGRL